MGFVENLLGETEKKSWTEWRMTYPTEYEGLVEIVDDPQNVTFKVHRIFLLEDPSQESTEEQNRAYEDLERLSCKDMKDFLNYINDFKVLAAKTGRMYISSELSEKFFQKIPPLIRRELEKAFYKKHPGCVIGIISRIHFSYQYLTELCKKAAL